MANSLIESSSISSTELCCARVLRDLAQLVHVIECAMAPRRWSTPPDEWRAVDWSALQQARRCIEDIRIQRHAEYSAAPLCAEDGMTIDVVLFLGVCVCARAIATNCGETTGYDEPCDLSCMILRGRVFSTLVADELDLVLASVWHNRRRYDWMGTDMRQFVALVQARAASLLVEHIYNGQPMEDYTSRRVRWACSVARIKCIVARYVQWTR